MLNVILKKQHCLQLIWRTALYSRSLQLQNVMQYHAADCNYWCEFPSLSQDSSSYLNVSRVFLQEAKYKTGPIQFTLVYFTYDRCPENIQPFWIPREPVAWPWYNLAASQRRHYCPSVNNHSPVGLVSRQWEAVDWVCILCDCRIYKSPPFQRRF
jgi:hypothetical protein